MMLFLGFKLKLDHEIMNIVNFLHVTTQSNSAVLYYKCVKRYNFCVF